MGSRRACSLYELLAQSIQWVRDDDRVRLSMPTSVRKPWTSSLPQFDADDQAYIRSAAAEVMHDWEQAGRPFLTPDTIAHQHKLTLSALRYTERSAR